MNIPDLLSRLAEAGPDSDTEPNLSHNQRQALAEPATQ